MNYLCFVLLVISSVHFGNCLYEDQVGKFDWKQTFVGKAKYSHIDLQSRDGKRKVIVATDSNALAALSLPTGSIIWRQVFEQGDYGKIQYLSLGTEAVTVSGVGPYYVRGWNPLNGVLLFEWSIPEFESGGKIIPVYWASDDTKLHLIRLMEFTIEVSSYSLKSGSSSGGTKTISATWLTNPSRCVVSAKGEVGCVADDGMLRIFKATSSGASAGPFTTQLPSSLATISFIPSEVPSLLVKSSSSSSVVLLTADGQVLTTSLPQNAHPSVVKHDNKHTLLIVTENKGIYDLSALEIESKRDIKDMSSTVKHRFPLSNAWISSVKCLPDSLYCSMLLVGDDDSLVFIEKGRLSWVREEALAYITAVEMIDLPVSELEAQIEKEFTNKQGGIVSTFIRRVTSQLDQLYGLLMNWLDIAHSRSPTSPNLVRDPFGLHKMLLIVTRSAKLFGIDNEKGDVIWQNVIKDVEPYSSNPPAKVPLFVQRTSRHHPYPAMASLLFKQLGNPNSVLYVFNPITGRPLEGGLVKFDYAVAQVLMLPAPNVDFIQGLVFLSSSGKVDVFPESTKRVALAHAKQLFMYTLDGVTGNMKGYSFHLSTNTELKANVVWTNHLMPRVVAAIAKDPKERVHSQGRVLGDRSVLYKYINPNLLAVASFHPDPVQKTVLFVSLIDVVTGNLVFSVSHKRVSQPIHLVHSENWVVYSYFNEKFRRMELVTLDLYEGKSQKNSTAFSSLDYFVEPLVERQSYIFPHQILAMKETITRKGITSKHVLMALGSGGVMGVPWNLLDPRRPTAPAGPEMREESVPVIPYIPELALPSETIITYNHSLANVRGIHTSPAELESTCLVLVHGLDIFYTRVAPSKLFDVLKDDFEYWLISAVLVGILTAAYVTRKLASMKALKQAWK